MYTHFFSIEDEVAQLQSIGVNKIIFDPGSLNPELAIDIQCVDELGSPITEGNRIKVFFSKISINY